MAKPVKAPAKRLRLVFFQPWMLGDASPTRTLRSGEQQNQRKGMDRRAFLTGAAAIGLGITAYEPALGQSFPSNVIRIVVPASASTPPDILARIIATALSDGEGWKVVVENKPGAVMTI